ncbi:site-specific integrase [Streptomyces sp. NBC_01764]|uniref:tyrosine-type recombinase/integrase n=1 Tax=Streptomyces sp. NBC_01764 TaxID=2975935 RepID=UPI0022558036|nr:tyrosine-type recombinase/integrase [Streptomyces sp. NBC_01764]MCX4403964.1 site-specific integrase [Streptomyces sp. NBC_01764]
MKSLHLISTAPNGTARSRTTSDRLELLRALIAAPTFDPLFREDVIIVPGHHPAYGWLCKVGGCQRASDSGREFCQAHKRQWFELRNNGGNVTEFLHVAEPLKSASSWHVTPDCLVCPDIPAFSGNQLCYLHEHQWDQRRRDHEKRTGHPLAFETWVAAARAHPAFGDCRVAGCAERAGSPLCLCYRHERQYRRDGRPGGARMETNWSRILAKGGRPKLLFTDEERFRRWCTQCVIRHRRANGRLSLKELRPLAKAEIQWAIVHHAQGAEEGACWPLLWAQAAADSCREQDVNTLVDLDLDACPQQGRYVTKAMLKHLRLIYFTREDTKDAGFIETEHFGVRFPHTESHIDLTEISQRWLRDLLWDNLAAELTAKPPRSRNPFDARRRGCIELSAFLQAQAPGGGHDPTTLTETHMVNFIADQRHRAQHGLESLGLRKQGRNGTSVMTDGIACDNLNGARRLLRDALETGAADRIGLDRAFIVVLPRVQKKVGRRKPFSDDVAKALASAQSLADLEALDCDDRGLRNVWEALVVTGRRCSEVLNLRLECIDRHGKIPMFWHDQTKVGNFDEGIRISERLFQQLESRQAKTIDRFIQRNGRLPSVTDRLELALFPRATSNRRGLKGVSYGWFSTQFSTWVKGLDLGGAVPHQARHTLATNLLRAGANLTHVKRYLGQISEAMAEHYVHIANTDPVLNAALDAVWVGGPGASEPGVLLAGGDPLTRAEAEALAIDLTRKSTPADGGFCTFQPVVNGDACPWGLNCHNCQEFVMSGADLVYCHRKREQWRMLAERAPDSATADYLHEVFEPTARAIAGLEKALESFGLLEEALSLDLRRPQDYFGRVWSTSFRARELAELDTEGEAA